MLKIYYFDMIFNHAKAFFMAKVHFHLFHRRYYSGKSQNRIKFFGNDK